MVKRSGIVKRMIAKGMTAALALALVMGMAPCPAGTVYAEPDDGYEGQDNDQDNDEIDDEDDEGSYHTEYDSVENEDGTWTFIETYYEDGVKTGSREETRGKDGLQTVTVWKDADGNVTETSTETMTCNEDGDAVKVEIVTRDGNGTLIMESVTEIHEDGSETRVDTYYDEDGQLTGSEETTTDDMGTVLERVSMDAGGNVTERETNSVETDADGNTVLTYTVYDGDGNVTRKTVETMGANSYFQVITDGDGNVLNSVSSTVTTDANGNRTRIATETDGDGNILNYEETRMDSEGNVTGTVQGFTMTDEDGTVTWYSREEDGEGNTVKAYMSEKDASGMLIREEETTYAEDGTHTVATTEYDANGNKIGITENTYDENGIGTKTVTKDAGGNVTGTQTTKTENDGNGNYTFTNTTYDGDGNLQEQTVTTMNFNTGDTTMVSTGADGSTHSLSYNAAERFASQVKCDGVQQTGVTGLTLDLAKAVCTAEELSEYEAGAVLTLQLETKEINVAATSADAVAAKEKLQEQGISMTGARYFDISLYKGIAATIASEPVKTQVTDTGNRQVGFIMVVPDDMRNQNQDFVRTFYLLRLHEGRTDVLAQGTGDQLSAASSLFSTYVLAYHDEKVDDDDDDDDDDSAVNNDANGAAGSAGQTAYATSPKTGEETHAGMWMWMWISLIGVAAILFRKERSGADGQVR